MIPANAAEAALQRLEGTVNSYVRGAGATMAHVEAQRRAAVRFHPDEVLRVCITRGATSPPNADLQRVAEIKARFLKLAQSCSLTELLCLHCHRPLDLGEAESFDFIFAGRHECQECGASVIIENNVARRPREDERE